MKKTLLLLIVALSVARLTAQNASPWQKIEKQPDTGSEKIRAARYSENEQYFRFNLTELKNSLLNIADRSSGKKGITISIPNSEGQLEQFSVWEKSNFEPELQARFPEIRSYIGKGITDKTATLYFSLSPKGIETMILRADKGSEFIEPYTKDRSVYVQFDSKTRTKASLPFVCSTKQDVNKDLNANTASRSDNHVFKTMRLALSCTAEYTAYHGGTVELALAAMNETMTRVNGVYNTDLAVQLNLIANEPAIIYTNAATDPYSSASGMGNWNGQLQANLTATIGNANYDIGHLFGATGGGGDAGCIGCVCVNNQKGSGITSPADGVPMGDTFDIDYVAHEMGHQLGAFHTFTMDYEGTEAQVEPGSGSTIMGYAGITGSTDVQAHSDAYFVYPSILEIQNNLATKSCPVSTALSNNTPVVDAGPDYTIPKSTPFLLKGVVTDADAADILTYTWEENDVATLAQSGNNSKASATKAAGPDFRSFNPTFQPVRYMPALNRILANTLTSTWEALPSISRDLNFTLTARDNSQLGGQTDTDAMIVHVVSGTGIGPFAVTAPNSAVAYSAGSNQNVTWDVAGTTANGINTPFVDIYFSADGGTSFPVLLASAVPNDGSELVTIPNTAGTTNRIMIKGHDNIFLDISNTNFAITAPEATQTIAFSGTEGTQNKIICTGSSVSYDFNYTALAGFSAPATFTATGNPSGTTVGFSQDTATMSGTYTMTINNLDAAAPGLYTIVVTSTSGDIVKSTNFYLTLGVPSIALTSPADLTTGMFTTVMLNWETTANASIYDIQVATDSGFTNIAATASTSSNFYNLTGLNELTDYYWRVLPKTAECSGVYSAVNKFTTGHVICDVAASTNVPVAISASGAPTITSTLNIPSGFTIGDLNVTAQITHSYVSDLTLTLIGPSGTQVQLISGQCGSSNNINAVFDDAGAILTCSSNPAINGTIKPAQPLSAFNGQPSAGTWTLRVADNAQGDGGSLTNWSLDICYAEQTPLAVNDDHFFNFAVYPNPNNGTFNIQSDKLTADKVNITVYDMRGRLIFENRYAGSSSFNENIKLENAQAGVYLLSVSDGENKEVKRIVVQ